MASCLGTRFRWRSLKKIASFVNKSAMDISILQRSLAILESMVLNSHDLYQKVAQEITIGQLIPHLQGTDQEIQTCTIAVINALFLKAPDERRQNHVNPAMDFTQTPPGMLALDNMLYFAKHHQDAYIRLIPFYKLSLCVAELCAIASSMSNFTSKIEVQTYKGLAVVRLQLAACPHSTCDCPQLAQWKKGSLAFLHLVASLA
ncbi:engulfment and cell motility protein 1-like isoform X5 [Dipodomys merriami]|uniref:engulfment and cell motility protein 1-like isoform X5 n=1 Tax=Dipodomys merriami TaxID=94247 RepID=UPI003855D47B